MASVETVVRLDGRPGRLSELVLTADVTGALSAVLEARPAEAGAAFFLVGHFGSGKSHLLAALAELAGGPGGAGGRRLGPGVCGKRPVEPGRRWPLPCPWCEHRAAAQLEDLVLGAAWAALGRPAPPAEHRPAGRLGRRACAAAGRGRRRGPPAPGSWSCSTS